MTDKSLGPETGRRRFAQLLERLPASRPPPEARQALGRRLDEHVAAYVLPMTGVLFFLYVLLVPAHLFWLRGDPSRDLLAAAALISAAALGAIWLLLRRYPISTAWAHPVAFALGMVPLTNSLLHIWVSSDPIHTTNVMLILLAAGIFMLRLRWFIWIQAIIVWGWVCVALLAVAPDAQWGHFAFGIGLSLVVSWVVFAMHRQSLVRLEILNFQLSDLARLDGLTGIANRRWFDARLKEEWAAHLEDEVPLSVVVCDLDHFKNLNDVRGHGAGDVALRQVAGVLRASARSEADVPARLGGEEFGVLLPRTTEEQALLVAERIREGILRMTVPNPGVPPSSILTASLGVASVTPDEGLAPQDLVAAADEALYEAKRRGRDRVERRRVRAPRDEPTPVGA
jgi:diguanylate cyclase (GGDEF)-like protein